MRIGAPQQSQRRRHRSGIGVVALIDHLNTLRFKPRAAALERGEILQCRRRVQHIAIGQRDHRQPGHNVAGDVLARRAHQAIDGAAQNVGPHPHAVAVGRE